MKYSTMARSESDEHQKRSNVAKELTELSQAWISLLTPTNVQAAG